MNKTMLLGRLTKDPEIRYTQTNNNMVATFSLAVNRRFVKEGEERQADFFNVVAWNKLAETSSTYLKKGMQVLITGKLQNRMWEDEQNVKHYVTEVICEDIEFIESRKKSQETDENSTNDPISPTSNNAEDISEEITNGDDLPF